MKNIGKYTFFYKDKIAQWSMSFFTDENNVDYFCAEQYMMVKKALLFNDLETYKLIIEETSPETIQKLGRNVKNFNDVIWNENKEQIIFNGNVLKFTQNEDLKEILLSTEDTILVEVSPTDLIYGIGLDINHPDITDETKWKGLNLLGYILMKVRHYLKELDKKEKYNRTYHCEDSEEIHSDDKTMNKVYENHLFNEEEVYLSVKLDGGNSGLKINGVFARTHAVETSCPSFNYIKNVHYYPKIGILNPDYNYFGENMYAKHSIGYNELTDYFYLFRIKNVKTNEWLSYDDMVIEAKRCDFQIVPVIFRGRTNSKEIIKIIKKAMKEKYFGGECEGIVITNVKSYKDSEWEKNICKYVRKGHVQTDEHWSKNWTKNLLKKV